MPRPREHGKAFFDVGIGRIYEHEDAGFLEEFDMRRFSAGDGDVRICADSDEVHRWSSHES